LIDFDKVQDVLEKAPADLAGNYRLTRVPKRNGGWRELAEPVGALREVQDWLVEHVWPMLHVAPCAHGFVAGRSILTHAAVHAPAHTLLTLDLYSFFDSVRPEVGIEMLRCAGLSSSLSVAIARLCWLSHWLPQGAPTSPGLSNACFSIPDAYLTALAQKFNARYSRYVDDLAFSWADAPGDSLNAMVCGAGLVLRANGYVIALDKSVIAGPDDPQLITGLVINAAPGRPAVRAPRERWRAFRAAVYNAERAVRDGTEPPDFAALHGLASFLAMTDPERVAPYVARLHWFERFVR